MRLRCWLDSFLGTVAMPEFWSGLVSGRLVVFDGHVIAAEQRWLPPVPSPDPCSWPGLVEYAIDDCVRCGLRRRTEWRRYYA